MDSPLTISLHLGAHKTASTHLQKSLQRTPGKLASAGIRFRGPKFLRDPERKFARIASAQASDLSDLYGTDPFGALTEGAGHLVLSDENLLGQVLNDLHPGVLYPRARGRIERLLDALAPTQVTLFVGLRDPASWLVSLYLQKIKGGHRLRFDDFCSGFSPTDLRWSGLIKRLLLLEAHHGIVVWRHEDYAAISNELLEKMLGQPVPEGVKLLPKRVNSSLSAAAMEHILSRQETGRDELGDWGRAAQEMFPLSEQFPPFDPWTKDERSASRETYDNDVDRIKSQPQVTFLTPD